VRKALKPTGARSILVSARHAFSDAYYGFFNPVDSNASQQTLAIGLTANVFPFSNLGDTKISDIAVYLLLEQAPTAGTKINASLGPTAGTAGAQLVAMPGNHRLGQRDRGAFRRRNADHTGRAASLHADRAGG
jgi:hypothetical protein